MEPNGARRLITGFPPVNYLSCDNNGLGKQTGCLFMWDDGDIQCVKGRQGMHANLLSNNVYKIVTHW